MKKERTGRRLFPEERIGIRWKGVGRQKNVKMQTADYQTITKYTIKNVHFF